MSWKIKIDPRALNELEKLDQVVRVRVTKFIYQKIASSENPRIFGKMLKGDLGDFFRYRVGDYRILCHIKDKEFEVLVIKVGHRRNVYN